MAIRDWLERMTGNGSRGSRTGGHEPPRQPLHEVTARSGRDQVIAYAVRLSGLALDQPDVHAFYRKTFANHPDQFVTYNDLRKHGDLIDKDALKALGLRANAKLSGQFLATLNESGRGDPMGAACVIGLTISTALCSWRDLQKASAAKTETVKFRASNMAAGPCECAASIDGARLSIAQAKVLPYEACPHPDQCGCSYQAWFEFMEGLELD